MTESEDQLPREAVRTHQREIERLNGELLAVRTLLFYFMNGATVSSPDLVRTAFDNAADFIERFAISAGKSARSELSKLSREASPAGRSGAAEG